MNFNEREAERLARLDIRDVIEEDARAVLSEECAKARAEGREIAAKICALFGREHARRGRVVTFRGLPGSAVRYGVVLDGRTFVGGRGATLRVVTGNLGTQEVEVRRPADLRGVGFGVITELSRFGSCEDMDLAAPAEPAP